MNNPAWEQFADAEKYDSTFDESFEIPYEITPTELKKRDKEEKRLAKKRNNK